MKINILVFLIIALPISVFAEYTVSNLSFQTNTLFSINSGQTATSPYTQVNVTQANSIPENNQDNQSSFGKFYDSYIDKKLFLDIFVGNSVGVSVGYLITPYLGIKYRQSRFDLVAGGNVGISGGNSTFNQVVDYCNWFSNNVGIIPPSVISPEDAAVVKQQCDDFTSVLNANIAGNVSVNIFKQQILLELNPFLGWVSGFWLVAGAERNISSLNGTLAVLNWNPSDPEVIASLDEVNNVLSITQNGWSPYVGVSFRYGFATSGLYVFADAGMNLVNSEVTAKSGKQVENLDIKQIEAALKYTAVLGLGYRF